MTRRLSRRVERFTESVIRVKEIGVATVPGSSFYAHAEVGRTKIRFCFPKTDDVLREAGARLQQLRAR